MSDLSVLAAEYPIHINTGTSGTPVWTEIKGVQTLDHSETTDSADTGSFNTIGRKRSRVTSRGDSFSFEGILEYDEDTLDAGQAALFALSRETGKAADGDFLIHWGPSGDGVRFNATANVSQFTGDKDGVAKFKAELEVTTDLVVGPLA